MDGAAENRRAPSRRRRAPHTRRIEAREHEPNVGSFGLAVVAVTGSLLAVERGSFPPSLLRPGDVLGPDDERVDGRAITLGGG